MKPEHAWELWGEQEPYYAVLSEASFAAGNLDGDAKEAFFASGRQHIDSVLRRYQTRLGEGAHFNHALDFGCGVGRLLVPLSDAFDAVTGVDVSASMLAEAAHNLAVRDITNVALVPTKSITELPAHFDLVHSMLVLQHIRPREGLRLLACLLDVLRPGGVAAIHITHGHLGARISTFAKYRVPLVQRCYRALSGKPVVAPMEMHAYNLDEVLALFAAKGLSDVTVLPGTMGALKSAFLFGVKVDV